MSCINELEDRLLIFLIGHDLEQLATAFALARVEVSQSMASASVSSDYTQARAGVTTELLLHRWRPEGGAVTVGA